MDFFKTVGSVVVIGVDDGKGGFDDVFAAEDCLSCSKWFFSSFGEVGVILEDVFDIDGLFDAIADEFFEIFFDFFADDEDYFIKACFFRIIDREI